MRVAITYRVNNGPCQEGYKEPACDGGLIYDAPTGGEVVAGAVVVPSGACPDGVYIVDGGDITDAVVEGATEITAAIGQSTAEIVAAIQSTAKDFEYVVLCDNTSTDKVAVLTDLSAATPTTTLWNLSTGASYTGTIADLSACGSGSAAVMAGIETVMLEACDSGTPLTGFAIVDETSKEVIGEVWRGTDGAWGSLPITATVGKCSDTTLSTISDDVKSILEELTKPVVEKVVSTGVICIGSGAAAVDYGAAASLFSAPSTLQSIAVTVLKAGTTIGTGNVVGITTTAGNTLLLSGMSVALSVAQDASGVAEKLADGITVQCNGDAAALIVYTY